MLRIQRGLKQAPETGTLRIVNDPSAPGKQHLAVSAIGSDHTGMVHDLTRVITDCGGNIAESRMAALGNEFAMLMLVTGNWHTLARIESELGRLADDRLAERAPAPHRGARRRARTCVPYSIDIVSIDQAGIVAGLSGFFAARNIDIGEVGHAQLRRPRTPARRCSRCR